MSQYRRSLQYASRTQRHLLSTQQEISRGRSAWYGRSLWWQSPARHFALETVQSHSPQPPPPGSPRPPQRHSEPREEPAASKGAAFTEAKSENGPESPRQPERTHTKSPNPSSGARSKAESAPKVEEKTRESLLPPGWEDDPDWNITRFEQLPHRMFGTNQHIIINENFKKALQQMLWQFRAPIRYAFAYGSGVFSQSTLSTDQSSYNPATSPHPNPSEAIVEWQRGGGKMIDMMYGVSYTQHWHSLNLQQHRDHYSFLGSLGSAAVSRIQDDFGAGVYFNPYITINGTLIKYGVVNLDTLSRDLSTWDTLYLAGRLQKPVKILRDNPRIRLANQVNLISAIRVAMLMLPESFTERDLYMAIAGISYLGDPRMRFWAENPQKVKNIVDHQLPSFRQLYHPLIEDLPNADYVDARRKSANWMRDDDADCKMQQDMDPVKRGNMVRRLPSAFRKKLYFLYQRKFQIPGREFDQMLQDSKDEDEVSFKRRQGGVFDRRIAGEDDLREMVARAIRQTVGWPSTTQSIKSFLTAGWGRSMHYFGEKRQKARAGTTPMHGTKDQKDE